MEGSLRKRERNPKAQKRNDCERGRPKTRGGWVTEVTRVQKGRFMGALAEKGTRDALLLIPMSLKRKPNLEL